ncbi:MAG: YraN family protein [Pseudomonadota bacterium]
MPASSHKKRIKNYQKGHYAESIATAYLMLKGYQILAKRHRAPVGEVDVIAKRSSLLCFCEVKLRANLNAGAWAVTPHQQQRIIRAAEHWLQRFPQYHENDIRFDVICLAPWKWPRHIKNAFIQN